MLVDRHLPTARKRLVTVTSDAPLVIAARSFAPGIDIVVVCDSEGALAGVVTKTDVVGRISTCEGASCRTAVSAVMTRDAVCCRPDDFVRDLWSTMKERGLRNVPVIGPDSEPLGVLSAGDVLQAQLEDVEDEEALLRDYVMCVGYR